MKKQTLASVHEADAVQKGFQKVMVHTVDTDVVVLGIAMFNQIGADELWLAFGTRSNFRYIPVHDVVAGMDPRICATLPVFHALTGCDTVSAFSGRGKKTAWNTWEVFPEVTEAFEDLDMSEATMVLLELFVVLLYDSTSDIMNVNDARKQRSTQKSRSLENLPPSQEALKQHKKELASV